MSLLCLIAALSMAYGGQKDVCFKNYWDRPQVFWIDEDWYDEDYT